MQSLIWSFLQIWSICYQNSVLGHFCGKMQETLLKFEKTLFWSWKVKIDMIWFPWAKLQIPIQKHPFGENHACKACLSHFGRFGAFATKIAFWVICVLNCNEHFLFVSKGCFGARKSKLLFVRKGCFGSRKSKST